MNRKCGNQGCDRDYISTFILGGQLERKRILFACDGCKRYLGPEELQLTVRSEEVIGADEDWVLAMSVMEECEIPPCWTPGLRAYAHPDMKK